MKVVGAVPSLMHGRVRSHDVVVGHDVGIPELFHPFCVGTHAAGVGADLGLGKHDADLHGRPPLSHSVRAPK
jgi:hypothetical protein